MAKSSYKRTSYRRRSRRSQEKELEHKLKLTVGALVATILIVLASLQFFGPKIGSFFLLISKNRNNSGPGDTIPPTAPIFSQVPEATNEKEITLNGITESGATVKIFVNGPERGETTADNDGFFTFVDLKMGTGNNIVFAKATDEKGNESEKSKVFTIIFDDEEPEIEITSPVHGDEIKNLNKRVLVQGNTNEETNITINGRQAVVKSDNTFELLLGVDEGTVVITVEATDTAGNTAKSSIEITYKKDS